MCEIQPILEKQQVDINCLDLITLKNFLRCYCTSKYYDHFATAIKSYRADKKHIEFLLTAKEKQLNVVPMDLPSQQYSEFCGLKTVKLSWLQRNIEIDKTLSRRTEFSFKKLKELYEENKNIILLKGALHYPLLSALFANTPQISVEHIFVYSSELNQKIQEGTIESLFKNIEDLQDIAFPISDLKRDGDSFMERIATRINRERQKNTLESKFLNLRI